MLSSSFNGRQHLPNLTAFRWLLARDAAMEPTAPGANQSGLPERLAQGITQTLTAWTRTAPPLFGYSLADLPDAVLPMVLPAGHL